MNTAESWRALGRRRANRSRADLRAPRNSASKHFGRRGGKAACSTLEHGESSRDVWEELGPVRAEPSIVKVGPDVKTARLLAQRFGQDLRGISGDTLLASYLLNPARYEQTLENVALHYLGLNLPGPRELAGRPTRALGLDPDPAWQ